MIEGRSSAMNMQVAPQRSRLVRARSWIAAKAAACLVAVGVVALTAPLLWLKYLPMTDFPQLYAVASIVHNLNDPRFGFEKFYRLARTETPYLFPFFLGELLSKFMPLRAAMQAVAWASVAIYPAASWALLRALGKPHLLTLLVLPVVFHRIVFWGFVAHDLSVGIALFACALMVRSRPTRLADFGVLLLSALASVTHLFGVAVLLGYCVLWAAFGDTRRALRRGLLIAPALVGAAYWGITEHHARGFGGSLNLTLEERVKTLASNALGGYQDASETWLLASFLATFLLLSWHRAPFRFRRFSHLKEHDRVLYAFAFLALDLYFMVPINTDTMKVIAPRFSALAICLLPLAVPDDALRTLGALKKVALLLLGTSSVAVAWWHLARFEREAKSFDEVVRMLPEHPKVLQLTFDSNGAISASYPYLHFSAYGQAERGGLIPMSFASLSWTMPVRLKEGIVPEVGGHLEWFPWLYDYRRFGYFYDYVLVRGASPVALTRSAAFPYRLKGEVDSWRLYER